MQEYRNISDILIHLNYCFNSNLVRDDAYIILDDTYVQYGRLRDYNEQYCIEHQLKEIGLNREGGTLIFFKGDFAYGHYGDDAQDFTRQWRNYLIQKLKDKGLNAYSSNNDIMIDNNKISGTTIVRGKMALGLISINPDAELIRTVCLKPSTDDFEGLSRYDINANQIAEWFQDFVWKY